VPIATTANACRYCGAKLTIRKRVYCDRCLPDQLEESRRSTAATFAAAGPANIAAMRAAGDDPTTTPEAQRRRASTASKQRKAVAAWRDDGSLDGVDFRRDILPKLQGVPVRAIAEAMGASISHGSKVRSGLLVPHISGHRVGHPILCTSSKPSGIGKHCELWAKSRLHSAASP
jgi:hypothetical protein